MKLKRSGSDVSVLHVDESKEENEPLKIKFEELDQIVKLIYRQSCDIVFDQVNILLNSADVEFPYVSYLSPKSESDLGVIRIAIEDQAGGGYLNFDFSFYDNF